MKLCDAYKCKRLALGMTQEEFGELVGVSGAIISKFEQGYEVSKVVFNCIKLSVENYIKSLDSDKYTEVRILEEALYLGYQTDAEKIRTLQHMAIHANKLSLNLLKKED